MRCWRSSAPWAWTVRPGPPTSSGTEQARCVPYLDQIESRCTLLVEARPYQVALQMSSYMLVTVNKG